MAPPDPGRRKPSIGWFRVDRDLPRHPKTARLASYLECRRLEAVGCVILFWSWVAEYAPNGELADPLMEGLCETLESHKKGLLPGLVDAGFLERVTGGVSIVHDWWEMNGAHVREVANWAERKKTQRNIGKLEIVPRDSRVSPAVDVDVDVDVRKESKENPPTPPRPRVARPIEIEGFPEWYQAYPKHVAKGAARAAYGRALAKTTESILLAGAGSYARSVEGKDRQFIAQPGTWLNQERWLDEVPAVSEPEEDAAEARSRMYREAIRKLEAENGTL